MPGAQTVGVERPVGIEVEITHDGSRRRLAIIDEGERLVLCAVIQKEAAAADVARLRQDDGKRHRHGNGCVDRVATVAKHLSADLARQRVPRDDHRRVVAKHGLPLGSACPQRRPERQDENCNERERLQRTSSS